LDCAKAEACNKENVITHAKLPTRWLERTEDKGCIGLGGVNFRILNLTSTKAFFKDKKCGLTDRKCLGGSIVQTVTL
jgi:hypothetical protein